MFCSIPWFVAFDPLPMGAPGAAENGGVWLGVEATGPPKPPVVAPIGPKPAPGSVGEEPRPPAPPALFSLVAECWGAIQ